MSIIVFSQYHPCQMSRIYIYIIIFVYFLMKSKLISFVTRNIDKCDQFFVK